MPFRLQAKQVFLTYARCDVTKEDLLNHLITLCGPPEAYRIGRELHEDGHPHLHVYWRSPDKFNTRDERYFDFRGHHPNITVVRNAAATWDYVGKDGDYVEFGDPAQAKSNKWLDVIEASTADEFDQAAIAASPRDYVINNDKLEAFKRRKFNPVFQPFVPTFTEFPNAADYPDLQSWLDQMNQVMRGGRSSPLHPPPAPPRPQGGAESALVFNPSVSTNVILR